MTRIRILIQAAEFQIFEQSDSDPANATTYFLKNAITDQIVDGGFQPEEIMSKLIRLANVRLPEVQV